MKIYTFRLPFIFLCSILLVFGASKYASAQVVINEFSCANNSTLADNYGEYEDWIELYNSGASVIDLTGYHLSDNPANPTKWPIPSGSINPGGYRIFFASKRNIVVGGASHTNFKLKQTIGETLVFADQLGVIVDSITIRPNQLNHSTGRTTNAAATWSVFTTPTPNAANSGAFTAYAVRPTFGLAPGFYAGAQMVALQTSDPNCTIRYTIDGTDPSAVSTAYGAPINVAQTRMIKARCFSSNPSVLPSFIETNTYFIGITHTLPVVSLGGNYTNLFNSWGGFKLPSSLEYFDKNGNFQFEGYGESDKHGNDSWAYAQKGVDYVVRDEYGYNDQFNYQIFHNKTRQKFQRIILKAAASDNYPLFGAGSCHIRDAFIQSLSDRAGLSLDGRASENCVLYINGQYWGVYEIREKMNDPDFTDYYYGQKEEDIDLLRYWGGMVVQYGSQNDWNDLFNYITTNSMAVQANYNSAASRIDVQSVMDYMILNTWAVNSDWIIWNSMWWRGTATPNVKWRYSNWDMDNTFDLGQNFAGWPTTGPTADPCALSNSYGNSGANTGHFNIFNKLMENPGFKSMFVSRYSQLTQTYLSCNYAKAFLDSMVANIAPEMPGQIARWGGNYATWQSNVQGIHNFLDTRCAVIDQAVIDCYSVSGPYAIMVDVTPALSGKVKWEQNIMPLYPNTATYFGSVNAALTAIPEPGFNFAYWEIKNANLANDTLLSLISYPITGTDTIIAHFEPIITHQLTVIAQPNIGGTVAINGTTPPTLPVTNTYSDNAAINLGAVPAATYYFVNYTINHHVLAPSDSVPDVFFNITATDTVIAHFALIPVYNLTLAVMPPNAGTLEANANIVFPLPQTTTQNFNDPFNLVANPNVGYKFVKYLTRHHSLTPSKDVPNVSFLMNYTDTIIALFEPVEKVSLTVLVEPKESGSVNFNFSYLDYFPFTDSVYANSTLNLEAKAYDNFNFSHWKMKHHILMPDTLTERTSCTVIQNDTIIAYFKEKDITIPVLFLPSSFTPNGDGLNDFLSAHYSDAVIDGSIKIYDRWGGLIYQFAALNFKWDGTVNGQDIMQGVYQFELKYKKVNGEETEMRGPITIIR